MGFTHDVVGAHHDGEAYCVDCVTPGEVERWEKEGHGGPILMFDEFDHLLVCARCNKQIKGVNYLPEAYFPLVADALEKTAEALEELSDAFYQLPDERELEPVINPELNRIFCGDPEANALWENVEVMRVLRDWARKSAEKLRG